MGGVCSAHLLEQSALGLRDLIGIREVFSLQQPGECLSLLLELGKPRAASPAGVEMPSSLSAACLLEFAVEELQQNLVTEVS